MPGNLETIFGFSKYALAFIGALFEGPIVMLAGGFLLKVGKFDFFPLYAALIAGDFAGDLAWYAIGRFGARRLVERFGKWIRITPELLEETEKRFKKYQDKILFISKITMGFGSAIATLVTAGAMRVSFKRYAFLTLSGGFIWTAFLLLVGYLFGNAYTNVPPIFKSPFLIGAAGIVFISFWVIRIRYFAVGRKQNGDIPSQM